MNPLGPIGEMATTLQSIGIDTLSMVYALCAVTATIMGLKLFTNILSPHAAGHDQVGGDDFEGYAKKRYKKELYDRAYKARHYGEQKGGRMRGE